MQQIRYSCSNCTYFVRKTFCNWCDYWNKMMFIPISCIREVTILDPEYDFYFDLELTETVPTTITTSSLDNEISQKENLIAGAPDKSNPSVVLETFDMLTGVQFKDLIEKHFLKNGYSVKRISPRINSVDFIIEKDGEIIAIATKKTFDLIQKSYISNVIESAKMYDNITNIMVITTSIFFMPQARQLAEENGIVLWDSKILKSQLGDLK